MRSIETLTPSPGCLTRPAARAVTGYEPPPAMQTSSCGFCTGPPETQQGSRWWLARLCAFGYHSRAMLSRAQEARVRDVLHNHSPGTIQTYCLEHLVAAGKIPPGHVADLAAFVRSLREYGTCRGLCDADAHATDRVVIWGPPTMAGRPAAPNMRGGHAP